MNDSTTRLETPPALDPPFRGYIETTYDALLVFEAARRGMIPRVTRRLIERERGMVQSGAVFVFDEHESGIKRWTDGLVWSPSRILGNFLVYRETDKRQNNPGPGPEGTGTIPQPPNNMQIHTTSSQRDFSGSKSGFPSPSISEFDGGRPRSVSEGQTEALDKFRERQLVGSLTNSYKFKDGGLVKKTMSVNVNGFAQHMVSYYSVADILAGRLRSPSSITELVSLEISPEYMQKQNFRFPPIFEAGANGTLIYKGESDESQGLPMSNSIGTGSQGSYPAQSIDAENSRPSTASVGVITPLTPGSFSQSQGSYFEQKQEHYPMSGSSSGPSTYAEAPIGNSLPIPPLIRQSSEGSVGRAATYLSRQTRRFDPYGQGMSQQTLAFELRSPPMAVNRSPNLSTSQQAGQIASPFLPIPDDVTYADSVYAPDPQLAGMPNSAPSHFNSFADGLSGMHTYQRSSPGFVTNPPRPSSTSTVRPFPSDMGRTQDYHSPGSFTPGQAHDVNQQYLPYGWLKSDRGEDAGTWAGDDTGKVNHVQYGACDLNF